MRHTLLAVFFVLSAGVGRATAQTSTNPTSIPPTAPITGAERVEWIVGGTVGPKSLGIGVMAGAWQTAWNQPEEWQRTWEGFGKRYVEREADVAISNTIEAGLGAIWGEDPRYVRSSRTPIGARIAYAARMVVLAPYRDGTVRPAWGRYAGNVVNNVLENAWLPPSITTPPQTVLRCASGFAGRLAGNLWEEFWPDIRERLR
jgi:hypothetical protein